MLFNKKHNMTVSADDYFGSVNNSVMQPNQSNNRPAITWKAKHQQAKQARARKKVAKAKRKQQKKDSPATKDARQMVMGALALLWLLFILLFAEFG